MQSSIHKTSGMISMHFVVIILLWLFVLYDCYHDDGDCDSDPASNQIFVQHNWMLSRCNQDSTDIVIIVHPKIPVNPAANESFQWPMDFFATKDYFDPDWQLEGVKHVHGRNSVINKDLLNPFDMFGFGRDWTFVVVLGHWKCG